MTRNVFYSFHFDNDAWRAPCTKHFGELLLFEQNCTAVQQIECLQKASRKSGFYLKVAIAGGSDAGLM